MDPRDSCFVSFALQQFFRQFKTMRSVIDARVKSPRLDHYEYMKHFSVIARTLRTRSATVRSGEPLCLATLYKLPLEDIVKTPPEIRIDKLCSIHPSLGKKPHSLVRP